MDAVKGLQAQTIQVTGVADIHAARRAARTLALAIGFGAVPGDEIALVVSELASNLVKHAGGGTILLIPLSDAGRAGIQVEAHDHGPGIRDIKQALADGSSTAGSLGYGLGTVNRLMDDLEIVAPSQPPHQGTHIVCKRFVRVQAPTSLPGLLDVGAATRPHPLMAENGDSFILKRWGTSTLIGVIDGLGHGQFAHRASQTARQYVETHYDQPLDAIFLGTNRACYATRGVVMTLVRFDWMSQPSPITFRLCGIGNVEVRVIGKSEPFNFVIKRGIVGLNAPTPVVTEHRWATNYRLVLYSDGISSRWNWEDFPELAGVSAQTAAQRLLQRLARDTDDATIVVVQHGQH